MKNSMLQIVITGCLGAVLLSGCTTPRIIPVVEKKVDAVEPEPLVKYSNESNYSPVQDRDYKRMTRQKMEDESDLHAGAGSLWVMEGQTSYLFAQNKQRRAGDPTKIKIEGAALKQLETKVSTIQELLNELEEQKRQAELEQIKMEEDKKKQEDAKIRLAEIEKEKEKIISENLAGKEAKAEDIQKMAEANVSKRMPAAVEAPVVKKPVVEAKKDEKVDLKDVEFIPSRIVEKLPDGMYRISGQQSLTIKKRPYKVIATGLVRVEDFDDEGVSSGKIFDPQYDIVHIKKTEKY